MTRKKQNPFRVKFGYNQGYNEKGRSIVVISAPCITVSYSDPQSTLSQHTSTCPSCKAAIASLGKGTKLLTSLLALRLLPNASYDCSEDAHPLLDHTLQHILQDNFDNIMNSICDLLNELPSDTSFTCFNLSEHIVPTPAGRNCTTHSYPRKGSE